VADSRRGDLLLYGLSAIFAGVTALTSTLTPHRVWGQTAFFGYALGLLCACFTLPLIRRLWLTIAVWVLTAIVPLLIEAGERAAGRTDRAQEEVLVVERAGVRLLHTGTPYLGRADIAALPADERLLGYTPYQPGMAIFGFPRALLGAHWFTDARIWFAVATAGCLWLAYRAVAATSAPLLRALQAATVLPLCALTLATGGDDIPVLALCLLAFAYAARDRFVAAGVAIGAAGMLKPFAWPVAAVLLALAWHRSRRGPALPGRVIPTFATPAFGLPLLALLPALIVDAGAFVENVVRFPGGKGLVTSPAQSPLLGRIIATTVPGGHLIAQALMVLAGLVIAGWLLRRPPADAARAALVSAVGLTAAIVLNPTTRFGYLLYPVAFVAAWWGLRAIGRRQEPWPTETGQQPERHSPRG
jgi:hypothetical protein